MMGRISHGLVAILLVALAILIVPVVTAGKSPPGSTISTIDNFYSGTNPTSSSASTSFTGATSLSPHMGVGVEPTLASVTGLPFADHAGVFLTSSPTSASTLHPLTPLGPTEEYDRALHERSTNLTFSTYAAPAKMKGITSYLHAARGLAYASWATLGNPRA